MNRRRFLAISAAFAACPAAASTRWQGRVFGAEAEITINAPTGLAQTALSAARAILDDAEALFSLHRDGSALSRLNTARTITIDDRRFHRLLEHCDTVHRLTNGRFDPTVQPLWRALALGGDPAAARAAIGWHRLRRQGNRVTLGEGQALTLNGIAQGYATDLVTAAFRALGLTDTLVNIGEFSALGGPWRIGITDPSHGPITTRSLTNRAIATSSPGALHLGTETHILGPDGQPAQWSTLSVEATTATLADGLSTGLCLADAPALESIAAHPDVHRITALASSGDILSIG